MRAMVLEEPGGPLVLREVPRPSPQPSEALLRVGACAVDRFDLAIRANSRERVSGYPHILGHEIAGEIAEVGSAVSKLAVGDRVAATLYLVCGVCPRCRDGRETICERFAGHIGAAAPGGYAEFVVLPARNLVPIPSHIGFPAASILANAIGTPFHALTARMHLQAGDHLVVTGAGGGVGLHAVQLARHFGAHVMAVEVGEERREAAAALGAEAVVDPTMTDLESAVREWTDGVGADAVLELVGPATMDAALVSLRKGGRMVIVGSHTGSRWAIDPGDIYRNEWEILGSRNVSAAELADVIDLVDAGHITPIVAGEHPLEAAETLHERVATGSVIGRDVLVP